MKIDSLTIFEQGSYTELSTGSYAYLKPRVLFEELLEPIDYELQFFLFNGQCHLTTVLYRPFHHKSLSFRLYDADWNRMEPGEPKSLPIHNTDAGETPCPPDEIFEKLRELCRDIGHVRVDFYVTNGVFYFSEFTFTHAGGKTPGLIGKYDAELGRFWSA
ncbi:ATP-grasp fold amidoligase family protein [Solemya elarraichensis gill symbiont]|uniref:Glycosyl transferase n=1 Tax=Solemya elarraichensis gill symbiont TaxID=1918949 RepID=A0A1T2KZZ1_9GAMM|nr:ATP-grasp fold amidoligase family protein [Solemya elarraichensis gill symbiont]OOZ38419.1 hypothetical protein BOW52_08600 [Solemya elarraichensis gill symbiont]